ncbi:MAG: hypothetical protein GY842_26200 [bacterium]|nr:hypothetical protein [bacterium]
MDPQLPGVSPTGAGTPHASVPCEQAIFTSVRTAMGQGYRLIASSPGLTPEEKTEITKRSPSHGGLCNADNGSAVAFYPLPGGRLCAALSCAAGQEQSGRGGLRIYTRAAVLDRSSFDKFAGNPLNVLRALEQSGLATPDLEPAKTLPVVHLAPDARCRSDETLEALDRVGRDWLIFMLQAALAERRVILAGTDDPLVLIEAVLLGLPNSVRESVSFASGLTFSIGRAFTLTAVSGDTRGIERIIRGHPLALVHPQAHTPPPPLELGEWSRMVTEYWNESAHVELARFTGEAFEDCSPEALERVAALRNETSRASVSGAAELLVLALRRVTQGTADGLENRLLADLLSTIRMRLQRIWSTAGQQELVQEWPALVDLVRKSPLAFQHLTPLVGLVLTRLAITTPLKAMEYALEIAGDPMVRTLESELDNVAEAVEAQQPQADSGQTRLANKLLDKWRTAFPHLPSSSVAIRT